MIAAPVRRRAVSNLADALVTLTLLLTAPARADPPVVRLDAARVAKIATDLGRSVDFARAPGVVGVKGGRRTTLDASLRPDPGRRRCGHEPAFGCEALWRRRVLGH